jgi:hypothetical protein
MFLMMSRKRKVPRSTKCCLKNWKKSRANENQRVKDSERKTMSESEVNERETFTSMHTDSLFREVSNKIVLLDFLTK